MATHLTRFEGKVNVMNLDELRFAAERMSDRQLAVFFKITKSDGLKEAHKVFLNEMSARILDEVHANDPHAHKAAAALRAGSFDKGDSK
jgi:hypothetical protein